LEIRSVTGQEDLGRFIDLPYRAYRDDPVWVAPLRKEQWRQFEARHNPMLEHCEYQLFLLMDRRRVVGRIAAFVDHLAVKTWEEPIGLFGSFECVAYQQGAHMLLDAARSWLQTKKMTAMRGPWSFSSQEWGMVVEGYTPSPVIMAPYNPPVYNEWVSTFGMEKVKDLRVYLIDMQAGYVIPDRYLRVTDRVRERYGIQVRPVDMDDLESQVETIMDLSNQSIKPNWGYYPVTAAESQAIANDIKRLVNPKAVLLAYDSDERPVGFAIALPDVNTLLKGLNGRMLPFGWLKMLLGLHRIAQYRMWALGVLPEYHGRGVDALIYRGLYEQLAGIKARIEINYVLEDNVQMNNALKGLGVEDLRRYRVYQMGI